MSRRLFVIVCETGGETVFVRIFGFTVGWGGGACFRILGICSIAGTFRCNPQYVQQFRHFGMCFFGHGKTTSQPAGNVIRAYLSTISRWVDRMNNQHQQQVNPAAEAVSPALLAVAFTGGLIDWQLIFANCSEGRCLFQSAIIGMHPQSCITSDLESTLARTQRAGRSSLRPGSSTMLELIMLL